MKIKCSRALFLSKRGFTLIELLVVVLIIGILAAVALPQYQLLQWKVRFSRYIPLLTYLKGQQEVFYLENGKYASSFDELGVDVPEGVTPFAVTIGRTGVGYTDKSGFTIFLTSATVGIVRGNEWVQPYGGLVMTYDKVSGKDVHGQWFAPREFSCFGFSNHWDNGKGLMFKICDKLKTGNTAPRWVPLGFAGYSLK